MRGRVWLILIGMSEKLRAGAEIGVGFARTFRRGWKTEGFKDLSELRDRVCALDWIPTGNLENFHRTSGTVRIAQLLALLAVGDAEKPSERENLAIFGVGGVGCRDENRTYWQDYASHGKAMGRSRLFVTTLTTAPACEAALTLGAHGPVQTLSGPNAEAVIATYRAERPGLPVLTLEINPENVSRAFLII